MNERDILEGCQSYLQQEHFDTTLLDAAEKVPWDILLLYLGLDGKKRERLVEITVRKQELGQALSKEKKDYFHINFALQFPFVCKDEMLLDLGSVILYLNRFLDLPGFELSESEARPFFRYVLLSQGKPDKQIVLAIAGLIGLYVTLYSELLEKVSLGEKTFNQILEEILEMLK